MYKKAYKFRLFPGKHQKTLLNRILNECRWVYNRTLGYRKEKWEKEEKACTKYDTNKLLPEWKEKYPSLTIVYAQTLQEVQERVDLAFRHFFRRVKNKENPGYPRFKGKYRYDSFTYPQIFSTIRFVEDNKIRLPKIGIIRFKKHRLLEGRIKRVTIKRSRTKKWYIIFSIEEPDPDPLPENNKITGFDLGLKSFAIFPDGSKIENPRFFKQDQKELAKAQRRFEKQKNGSKKKREQRRIIARIHERIKNKRNNFTHQLSRKLIDKFQYIVLEKLDIKSMQKDNYRSINRSIQDVAWNKFKILLLYKAEEAGRVVIQIDPAYTTQTCSRCGTKKKLMLEERTYSCEMCNLVINRDQNAAINILRLGLQSLGRKNISSESLEASTFG